MHTRGASRTLSLLLLAATAICVRTPAADAWHTGTHHGTVLKNGVPLDLRSHGRQLADDLARTGGVVALDETSPVPGTEVVPPVQFRGGNVQTNDGTLDNVQTFPNRRPFVLAGQSETSIAAFGRNIVATYNTSAKITFSYNALTDALTLTGALVSGFSTSNDGGQTWTSGFMPPMPGSAFTFGDPVVAKDRRGVFYFAGLGQDASGGFTIQLNKSIDGGRTWSDAVVVQQDDEGDKEWLAVGPDPTVKSRDNIYVTWTSFQPGGTELRFGRSLDRGATWTTKTIFAPASEPPLLNKLQFSNPYVDPITGRLYVPFLQLGSSDSDYIRILVSDDAGDTFAFLPFNVQGAPSPTLLPVVLAGTFIDCGNSGDFRLVIRSGPALPGRSGRPTYVHASRLITQPAFAARNGVLSLAWSNSTSQTFGDPSGHSNVLFIRSDDGGQTWGAPVQVNPPVGDNIHHVLPALAIDQDPTDVHISYYTQHADGTVDLDLANSHDAGTTFPANRTLRITSTGFALAPTNIPLAPPAGDSYPTTNYDRSSVPCYSLGEYQSVTAANGSLYVLWGDSRNSLTEPVHPLDPISGQTHPQEDVFFQKVMAQ